MLVSLKLELIRSKHTIGTNSSWQTIILFQNQPDCGKGFVNNLQVTCTASSNFNTLKFNYISEFINLNLAMKNPIVSSRESSCSGFPNL